MTATPVCLGCDPGGSGGLALVYSDGTAEVHKMPETPADYAALLGELKRRWPAESIAVRLAVLEEVQPGGLHRGREGHMGAKSAFTFGRNVGRLETALAATHWRVDRVRPADWQKAMGCRAKGDKNVLKRRAQELFPVLLGGAKVTLWNADALLIAAYGAREVGR